MRRYCLIFFFFLLASSASFAQQLTVVDSIEEVPRKDLPVGRWQTDLNGDSCALVYVRLRMKNKPDMDFKGDIVEPMEERSDGWLVWMVGGANYLRISSDNHPPKVVGFGDIKVLSSHAYSMTIGEIEELTLVTAPYADDAAKVSYKEVPKVPGSNKKCALIRINMPIDSVSFEGNVSSQQNAENGEWWVWVAPGTGAITINAEGYAPLVLQMNPAKEKAAYRATLLPPEREGSPTIDMARQKMEELYAQWKTSNGSAAVSLAERLHSQYPDAIFDPEVKHFLFEHYLPTNTDKAAKYAVSRDEIRRLEERVASLKKEERHRKHELFLDDILWRPAIGAGLEVAPLANRSEIAIPVDMMLFEDEKKFNVNIGAHIVRTGTWMDHFDTSFSYWQVSPKVSLLYNTETLYYSLTGIMDMNFGYYLGKNQPVSGVLSSPTYSVAAEVGLYEGDARLYLYYKYDITRPVSDNTLNVMQSNPADYHYDVLNRENGDMLSIYKQRGMLGIGLVIYFVSLRSGHEISH